MVLPLVGGCIQLEDVPTEMSLLKVLEIEKGRSAAVW